MSQLRALIRSFLPRKGDDHHSVAVYPIGDCDPSGHYVLGMVGIAQQLRVGIMIVIVILVLLILLSSGSIALPAVRTR